MEEIEKKQYELGVLLKTEDDMASLLAVIAQHGGTVEGNPNPKKIALAYPVKKHKEAVFVSCLFIMEPQNAKLLEKALTMKAEVLRSILIANPPAEEKRQANFEGALPRRRMGRPAFRAADAAAATKPAVPAAGPISNEALEKKIEEILK